MIVQVEKVQVDLAKYGLRPGTGSEKPPAIAAKEQRETKESKPASPTPKPRKAKEKAENQNKSEEVEFVSTYAMQISRPTTPADEDVEFVSMESANKPRRKSTSSGSSDINLPRRAGLRGKKRHAISSPEMDRDEDEAPRSKFSDSQRREIEVRMENLEHLSSSDIAALSSDWLRETEHCRSISSNIKGSLTRKMKVNIGSLAEAVKVLAMRSSQEGDVGFLRTKLMDMQKEITGLREENEKLKLQMEDLRCGMKITGSPVGQAGAEFRDIAGPSIRSPEPPRETGMEMSPIMAALTRAEEIARPSPRTKQQRASPKAKEEVMGDGFFEKLSTTISNSVVNAMRTQMLVMGAMESGRREGARRRDIQDRLRQVEEWEMSPAMAESPAIETEEDGDERAMALRKKDRQSRARKTRKVDVKNVITNKNRETEEEPKGRMEFPPLPAVRDRNADLQQIPGNTPKIAPPREVKKNTGTPRRRVPRSSAITISCQEGGLTYAEIIRKAREEINLEELGIQETRMRNTVAGGVLIELPGENTAASADTLAKKLRDAFCDTMVMIRRPMLRGELRLAGLDASVTPEELKGVVARTGGCDEENVRLGSFRFARNGLRTVWLQCPLATAAKLAEGGWLRVGWSTARVELLRRRPLRCFRCLAAGHVRDRCPSETDRSDCCFNCGESGHPMRDCGRAPNCPICKSKGMRHDHRAGSEFCPPCPPKKERPTSPRSRGKTANRSETADDQMET
ncbi:PREDICTED: uncharacterized protein LOC105461508 [Wasmannia auropunctata]|uniref:uncharacterized protein LOC105461508 n=1 Tax=Wasmannia auropunctata TaxID=64793 RepID=UPI0005EE3F1B|nr:PREDICTED: uncharacterized protein LOC105461508 [Wasmannia auropunctata]